MKTASVHQFDQMPSTLTAQQIRFANASALTRIALFARFYDHRIRIDERKKYFMQFTNLVRPEILLSELRRVGMRAKITYRNSWTRLTYLPTPMVLMLDDGIYALLLKKRNEKEALASFFQEHNGRCIVNCRYLKTRWKGGVIIPD